MTCTFCTCLEHRAGLNGMYVDLNLDSQAHVCAAVCLPSGCTCTFVLHARVCINYSCPTIFVCLGSPHPQLTHSSPTAHPQLTHRSAVLDSAVCHSMVAGAMGEGHQFLGRGHQH
jgi:hypothetical protein